MEDWKIIGQSRTGIDLEVQKGLLEEIHQIPAVVVNKKFSAYDLGSWELYVHKDNFEQADSILNQQEKI
jgi:hypothetical protein